MTTAVRATITPTPWVRNCIVFQARNRQQREQSLNIRPPRLRRERRGRDCSSSRSTFSRIASRCNAAQSINGKWMFASLKMSEKSVPARRICMCDGCTQFLPAQVGRSPSRPEESWVVHPPKGMKNVFPATTVAGRAVLPFVISTGAPKERSGEICGVSGPFLEMFFDRRSHGPKAHPR